MANTEIWKPIYGYEKRYNVSNLGRFKRVDHTKVFFNKKYKKMISKTILEKILKPRIHTNGYLRASLCVSSISKDFYIHRLVAQAFIPNPKNKPEVNHLDGDKTNNQVSNLEWCTTSENRIHAFKHKLNRSPACKGSHNGRSKITEDQVLKIRNEYVPRKISCRILGEKYNLHESTIRKIVCQKAWTHI